MKLSKYIIIGCLSLMLGFSSCEMKDELLGNKETATQMGTLEVDLASVYNNGEIVIGRAGNTATDSGETEGNFSEEDTNVDNYTLIITNTDTQTEVEKGLVKDLKGEDGKLSFPLEAGKYNVKAYNYDGANVTTSERPYFEGSTDFTIEGGKGASVPLTCKLACIEVALNLTDSFKEAFKDDYSITVDNGDGASNIFTKDNIGTKLYFKTPVNKNSLNVSVKATSVEENPIDMKYTVQKPDAEGNLANLEGGDAFLINLTEAGATDSYVQIGISVDLTFTPEGSSFEIPIENITGGNITVTPPAGGGESGGGDTPAAGITFTGLPATYNCVNGDQTIAGLQNVRIQAADGIKKLEVTISGEISTLAGGMLGTLTFDICNLGEDVKAKLVGLELITEEDYTKLHAGTCTDYTFNLGRLLVLVPQVTTGTSTFNLSVNDGVTTSGGNITVNVSAAGGE